MGRAQTDIILPPKSIGISKGIASRKAEGFECRVMSERFKGQWLNEKEEEER